MKPHEIFGLLAAGALLIYVLLAVMVWLEARLMGLVKAVVGNRASSDATTAPQRGGTGPDADRA